MTEKEALNMGYSFTGTTSNFWDEKFVSSTRINKEAKKIRSLGFKCYICTTTKNSWGGGCKVLMAEQKYFDYERVLNLSLKLSNNTSKIERLLEEVEELKKSSNELSKEVEEYKELNKNNKNLLATFKS